MDFEYYIENGEVTITGLKNSTSKSLIIPEFIDGYPVVKIKYDLIYSTFNIIDVVIPTSILDIDSHALYSSLRIRTINGIEVDDDKLNTINNRFIYYYNIFYKIKYQICDGYSCDDYNNNVKYFIDNGSYYSSFI